MGNMVLLSTMNINISLLLVLSWQILWTPVGHGCICLFSLWNKNWLGNIEGCLVAERWVAKGLLVVECWIDSEAEGDLVADVVIGCFIPKSRALMNIKAFSSMVGWPETK